MAKTAKTKSEEILKALSNATPMARKKMRLALKPRNATLSLHFNEEDIADWNKATRLEGEERKHKMSLTDCIEEVLNEWAAKRLGRAR